MGQMSRDEFKVASSQLGLRKNELNASWLEGTGQRVERLSKLDVDLLKNGLTLGSKRHRALL
jgi:hypothetical protein